MKDIINKIKGGLIVSCQALEDEPLHGSFIMSRMALAAKMGGASGIRSNSRSDIIAIKNQVELPIIGSCKRQYGDNPVFITPTIAEVREVVEAGADIAAIDATMRPRPDGVTLKALVEQIRKEFPSLVLMGDISTFEEAKQCDDLGVDLVGSTLSGYTAYTAGRSLPDFPLLSHMTTELHIPIIAEGGIWTPSQLNKVMNLGVHAAVIGSAITKPLEITRYFLSGMDRA